MCSTYWRKGGALVGLNLCGLIKGTSVLFGGSSWSSQGRLIFNVITQGLIETNSKRKGEHNCFAIKLSIQGIWLRVKQCSMKLINVSPEETCLIWDAHVWICYSDILFCTRYRATKRQSTFLNTQSQEVIAGILQPSIKLDLKERRERGFILNGGLESRGCQGGVNV